MFKRIYFYFKKGIYILKNEGLSGFAISALNYLLRDKIYHFWWLKHSPSKKDLTRMKSRLEELPYTPLISIIMPVFDPNSEFLISALKSVQKQIYPNWELCICDDFSTDSRIKPILNQFAKQDSRIKLVFHDKNQNISAASNSALELATGEYIALLDHDDLLAPSALFEAVNSLNNPTIQQSNNPTIQQSNNPAIQQSNNLTIQQSNNLTIQQFNNPTIQQSNNPTIQQSNHSNYQTLQFSSHSTTVSLPNKLTATCPPKSRNEGRRRKSYKLPLPDVIYTDEDKITPFGFHNTPFFKPDWSPHLLLSIMYLGHLCIYKHSLLKEISEISGRGFRLGYEGSQDYDLALRFTEKTNKILHISKILYHWRQHQKSAAQNISAKSYAYSSAIKALNSSLERRNLNGKVKNGLWDAGSYRIRPKVSAQSNISAIITFQDNNLLLPCLESLKKQNGIHHLELNLIAFSSIPDEKIIKAAKLPYRIFKASNSTNLIHLKNKIVKQSLSDYLLFLNDNLTFINSDGLNSLLELASLPFSGVIGGKILFANSKIHNTGLIFDKKLTPHYAFQNFSDSQNGPLGQITVIRNYSAVSSDCFMVKKDLFQKLRGFNEKYKEQFYEYDLCLKAIKNGYYNVYTPFAKLIYSKNPDEKINPSDQQLLFSQHQEYFQNGDPFYNPNFNEKGNFGLKW